MEDDIESSKDEYRIYREEVNLLITLRKITMMKYLQI